MIIVGLFVFAFIALFIGSHFSKDSNDCQKAPESEAAPSTEPVPPAAVPTESLPQNHATEYALGFLFTEDLERVVLLRKKSPDWQTGRLNGLDGKLSDTMQTICVQHTGIDVPDWKQFGQMRGQSGWRVALFAAKTNMTAVTSRSNDEALLLTQEELKQYSRLHSIDWLVPMAANFLLSDHLDHALIHFTD